MLSEKLVFTQLESKSLEIAESANYDITIDASGLLFFNLKDASKVNFNFHILDNVQARIIFWNEGVHNAEVSEHYEVGRDANLNIIYGELSDGSLVRSAIANLRQGSEVLVEGASITASNKRQTFIANHLEKYTTSNLNNYGIVTDGGEFFLDVTGKIFEDAVGSKAHQDSKILTLSENQKTQVIPQLLIYENDVEASHAATVGQVDEMQLYYMQSRGLSEMEATSLLMSGYLLPIARAIEDEELRVHVQELIADKVDEICSIDKK